jgi:cell division septation protein DedD
MPSEQEREFELVLGNKQLFSVLFLVIVLLAVFFALGYTMGRSTASPEVAAKGAPDAATRTEPTRPSPTEGPAASVPAQPQAVTPRPEASYPLPTPSAETAVPKATRELAPVSVPEPQAGQSFWQVSAVAKPEAELLVEVLTKKGFRAIVAPGPNEKLFRVLVGPARDQAELGQLRTDLEKAGVKPYLRKY